MCLLIIELPQHSNLLITIMTVEEEGLLCFTKKKKKQTK
jgi:hypothetical protein